MKSDDERFIVGRWWAKAMIPDPIDPIDLQALFDACQHEWEPAKSEFGEGRYCHKCRSFQFLEEMAKAVPKPKDTQ